MKIIKKGENWCAPTFTEVMVECSRCGSKLEIEADDVMERDEGVFFECPVCCEQVRLSYEVSERYWYWKSYMNKIKRNAEKIKQDKEREKRLRRMILGEIATKG